MGKASLGGASDGAPATGVFGLTGPDLLCRSGHLGLRGAGSRAGRAGGQRAGSVASRPWGHAPLLHGVRVAPSRRPARRPVSTGRARRCIPGPCGAPGGRLCRLTPGAPPHGRKAYLPFTQTSNPPTLPCNRRGSRSGREGGYADMMARQLSTPGLICVPAGLTDNLQRHHVHIPCVCM